MLKIEEYHQVKPKLNKIPILSLVATCTVATALKLENWTDLVQIGVIGCDELS